MADGKDLSKRVLALADAHLADAARLSFIRADDFVGEWETVIIDGLDALASEGVTLPADLVADLTVYAETLSADERDMLHLPAVA